MIVYSDRSKCFRIENYIIYYSMSQSYGVVIADLDRASYLNSSRADLEEVSAEFFLEKIDKKNLFNRLFNVGVYSDN